MSSRGDDKDPSRRQWGQDDPYDDGRLSGGPDEFGRDGGRDPYDSYNSNDGFPHEEYTDDFEYEVEVDDESVDALSKDIMEKQFPGLGGGPLGGDQRKKSIDALGSLAYVGCAELALLSGIQGLLLGSAIGAVQTGFAGAAQGMIRQPGFGGFVWQQAKSQGKQFGIWLSCFTGMKCTLTFARGGKQDIFNVFGSGMFAGSVATLSSRNPPLIALNGLGSAVIVSVLHLVGFGL